MISFTSFDVFSNVKNLWVILNSVGWTHTEFIYTAYWTALSTHLYLPNLTLDSSTVLFSGSLFIFSLFFNMLFIWAVASGVALYILNQGLRLISNSLTNTNTYHTTFSYLTDLEEELGSADDALMYFVIFAAVILWFFFFIIFSSYLVQNLTWFIMLLNLVGLTAIFIPFFVLKNFGIAFTSYVRGAGRTSNLVAEAFFDFIAVTVMVARFIIQNIRLVLLFAAFFEISEFIYDKLDIVGNSFFGVIFNTDVLWGKSSYSFYWYDFLLTFLTQQILLLYYQGHLIITLFAQLANYFLLSFALFFFLYTTFTLEPHEKYFLYSKIN